MPPAPPSPPEPSPAWLSDCAALAEAAGLMHDLGKFNQAFQDKLHLPAPSACPVRHEWISLFVVRNMLQGNNWEQAWQRIRSCAPLKRWKLSQPGDLFSGPLNDAKTALLFLIATHHLLPQLRINKIGNEKHVRQKEHQPQAVAVPAPEILKRMQSQLSAFNTAATHDDCYWRAVASIARMALILADHSVSSLDHPAPNASAWANTLRTPQQHRLNQGLDWHLLNVGQSAHTMVQQMAALRPPTLAPELVRAICAPTHEPARYAWQARAAQALAQSREQSQLPHLIFNMAGTGSGKTRMNVRALCALGAPDGSGIRIATALNLRTLSLQTGDAYAEQLSIPPSQLSTVIGDQLVSQLNVWQKSLQATRSEPERKDLDSLMDDDENLPQGELETSSHFCYDSAPKWLQDFFKRQPHLSSIIGAPVLVSTIDFLIAAGEPQRQGHHALAALRLMHSDLILDEIDGYEPKPLLAVLRLISMAAMFGRNVVASSATLSRPVAKRVWQAFAFGMHLRASLGEHGATFATALIDDFAAPGIGQPGDVAQFDTLYDAHLASMLKGLQGQRLRPAQLQRLPTPDLPGWHAAIVAGVQDLHRNTAWLDPASGKTLSLGLVRVAHIATAVEVASLLAQTLPQARVACYHAQHLVMQRFHIEQQLDQLLKRHHGDEHILQDPHIRQMLQACPGPSLMLIVVASPVEEIGRDHDFDWAVLEPSSAQSLVQCAGRVNRHRLLPMAAPNIAILQFNRKAAINQGQVKSGYPVFTHPGLEPAQCYSSHDLDELLDWSQIEQIDARLRLDQRHKFAQLDDGAIDDATLSAFGRWSNTDSKGSPSKFGHHWMGMETYLEASLRDKSARRIEMRQLDASRPDSFMVNEENGDIDPQQRLLQHPLLPRLNNDWLTLSDAQLIDQAKAAGVDQHPAMTVRVSVWQAQEGGLLQHVRRHASFGFFSTERALVI